MRNILRNAYIIFRTAEDRAQGCEQLLPHSPVTRLSNDVFCIPWKSLALLDACLVEYTFATQDDLSNARWIQHDGTEDSVAGELAAAGVLKDRIVLAFRPLSLQETSEFATA